MGFSPRNIKQHRPGTPFPCRGRCHAAPQHLPAALMAVMPPPAPLTWAAGGGGGQAAQHGHAQPEAAPRHGPAPLRSAAAVLVSALGAHPLNALMPPLPRGPRRGRPSDRPRPRPQPRPRRDGDEGEGCPSGAAGSTRRGATCTSLTCGEVLGQRRFQVARYESCGPFLKSPKVFGNCALITTNSCVGHH